MQNKLKEKTIEETKREERQRIADYVYEYLEYKVEPETMKKIMSIVFDRAVKD